MFELDDSIKKIIDEKIQKNLGLSYEEYSNLDIDEQQQLMKIYHEKKNHKKSKNTLVMIGIGENTTFIKVKRGDKVMLFDGTMIKAGETIEEYQKKLEERYDEIADESTNVKQKILTMFRKK